MTENTVKMKTISENVIVNSGLFESLTSFGKIKITQRTQTHKKITQRTQTHKHTQRS
jgi:hypothetical protein